ncbi:MAG: DUF664 domain-containing protein [Dermatophilaceae bacterium]
MAFLTPEASGERAVAKTFLLQQFAQARSTVYGLSNEQIHARPSVSAFTPAMLITHLTQVADGWCASVAAAPNFPAGPNAAADGGDYEIDDPAGVTIEGLLTAYDQAVGRLGEIVESADFDAIVPTPPAPWYPPELVGWQVRWVIQHLIAEVARHAGHADIIRESIDGKGSYELNARADGELADDQEFPAW